jgi:modification methylase
MASGTLKKYLNKFNCGDAVEVMQRLPDGCVDVVVTSPPYNLKNSTGNGMKDGRGSLWVKAEIRDGYAEHADNMPHGEYVAWQRAALTEMLRLLKPTGAIFYNHKWRVQGGLLQDRSDIVEGFPVRQIIVWNRNVGINFNAGYFLPTYEVVYLIAKPAFRLAPKANAYGDVWSISMEMKNNHPAPFPLALADRCVASTTGQVVLDPFMGSGTTALAAVDNDRDFIGIELSKEYCVLAERRLSAHSSQSKPALLSGVEE